MVKKLIRLTESDLHRIIKESVNSILNEIGDTYDGQYMLGRLAARENSLDNKSRGGEVLDYAERSRKNTENDEYDVRGLDYARKRGRDDQLSHMNSIDDGHSGYSKEDFRKSMKAIRDKYPTMGDIKKASRDQRRKYSAK